MIRSLLCGAVVACFVLCSVGTLYAQGGNRAVPATDPHAGHAHTKRGLPHPGPKAPVTQEAHDTAHVDKLPKNSKPTALLFWLFALLCVVGAVFVLVQSNLVVAVMAMVGTFFAIAVVYAMLYAHFLAAIQVLVYAGAIMVLFVFVIMILNRPVDMPRWRQGMVRWASCSVAIAYLTVRLAQVLWNVGDTASPQGLHPGDTIDKTDFGSTAKVGAELFTNYLFPFEAVSLVLLVAVVGALFIARPEPGESDVTDSDSGKARS